MSKSVGCYLLTCVVLSGCAIDGTELSDELAGDESKPELTEGLEGVEGTEATAATEQALGQTRTHATDVRNWGGNISPEDFRYVIGGFCSPGHVRVDLAGDPSAQWFSQSGGYCAFDGWVTPSNPSDCHAYFRAHTGGGFFGGTCLTTVHEQEEGPRSFSYAAANTNNAMANTTNRQIVLGAGQTLTIGTSGVPGSSFSGDTFLVLRFPMAWPWMGQIAALNDDVRPGLVGSLIVFTAPVSGTYTINAGCFSSQSCSGTVAW